MRTSEAINELFPALQAAHGKLKPAAKDSINPAYKSKYADLASYVEVLQPVLAEGGLFTLQEVTSDDSGAHVTTRICHASGQWIEFGPLYMPANKHDAQGFGSATTYARRYALSAAWNMVADDDDGNKAVESQTKTEIKPKVEAGREEPVGYADWLKDMQKLAETAPGLTVFKDSYVASQKSYRAFLERTNPELKEAMKARAAAWNTVGAKNG